MEMRRTEGKLTRSQGRDNTVRFYAPLSPSTSEPPLVREMPSNALNFCAFSLAHLPGYGAGNVPPIVTDSQSVPAAALLALPNLTDSELVRPADCV